MSDVDMEREGIVVTVEAPEDLLLPVNQDGKGESALTIEPRTLNHAGGRRVRHLAGVQRRERHVLDHSGLS